MSSRGIDYPRAIVGNQRHRFARSIIGQAQDHDIGIVQRLGTRLRVLATMIIEQDQRKFAAARQTRGNFQPGGPGCSVDEDGAGHNAASAAIGT